MKFPGLINASTNLTQWSRDLEAFIRSITPRSSGNIAVSCGPGGATFLGQPSSQRGYTPPILPFTVIKQIAPGTGTGDIPATYQWGVLPLGKIYRSIQPNSHVAFGSGDATTWTASTDDALASLSPASDDPAWHDMILVDAIWMTGIYDAGLQLTSLTIDSWGDAGEFDVTAAPWEDDSVVTDDGGSPPLFQAFRKLISFSVDSGDGLTPLITQMLTKDQLIRAVPDSGKASFYPFDHSGGYPL